MKGNGNSVGTLLRKLYFFMLPTSGLRTKYIRMHANMFRHIGEGVFWQPRSFPTDPELISLGENVKISSNVVFVNHDVTSAMLNRKYKVNSFESVCGCIEIGDNCMIGTGVTILPDVRIGSNVVIGAGSVVSKDIPDNSVAAGIPCRVIGDFEHFVEKRREYHLLCVEQSWERFYKMRKEHYADSNCNP